MNYSIGDEDFILKKGSLDILYMLADGPKSFYEFKTPLKLSPNTIVLRLKAEKTLGIIEQLLEETKGRSRIKYRLAKRGKMILNFSGRIRNRYLELKKEINDLEMKKREKEFELQKLLLSLQEPVAQILKSNPINNRN